MVTFGIILLVLFFLAVMAAFIVQIPRYRRFRRTPECVWRDRVFIMSRLLKRKFVRLARETEFLHNQHLKEVEKEERRALLGYLSTLSVDLLQAYPGIGPATVERLRGAGFATLDRFMDARFDLPGIGVKRNQDLDKAVRLVLKDAITRFNTGAFPGAKKINEELNLKVAKLADRIDGANGDLALYAQTMLHLYPLLLIANRVTFLAYMKKEPIPELTPEILATPLSDYFALMAAPAPASAAQEEMPTMPPPPVATTRQARWMAYSAKTEPVIGTAPIPLPAPSVDLFRAAIDTVPSAPVAAKPEHPRLPHLLASVQFAFAIARADGKVANSERKAIRQYLQQSFGYEPALSPRINPLMEQTEKKTPNLDETLVAMRNIFDAAELQKLYRFACEVADAAGKRNAKEISCLKKIAVAWGIDDQKAPTPTPIQAQVPVPVPVLVETPKTSANRPASIVREQCFAALEIALGTPLSVDLVRRQYRLLTERFDPVKFESQGTDFVTLAKEKREKAERAARVLLEQLGAKLEEETAPETPKDPRHNPDLDAVFGN